MRKTTSALALAAALAMTLGAGTTALAETMSTGEKSIDVTAKHNDGTTTSTVYSVDLTWEDMTFTYNESGSRTWDPTSHTYTGNTTAGWDKTTADITATNHSNAAVKVSFDYTQQGNSGITGSMSQDSFVLDNGEGKTPAEAASNVSALTISGTPTADVSSSGIKVGTITVTISAA